MYLPTMLPVTRGSIKAKGSDDFSRTIKYRVFDCWHKEDENLVPIPKSSCQRFAVMYRGVFDHGLLDALEHAYRLGGIYSVKLIDVNKRSLYIFLDAKVASSSVAAIESIWLKVARSGCNGQWDVHFASESEIWSGRSDYDFLSAAKEVIESYELGFIQAHMAIPEVQIIKHISCNNSEKQPSLERPAHAPLPTTVVLHLNSAVQFISYFQIITEGDFRMSGCIKNQLHMLKIALQLATGLRLPGEPEHLSLAVRPLCATLEDDSVFNIMKASLGHKSEPFASIYARPRTIVGGCPNTFSSKYEDVDNLYLRRIDKLVAKQILRQKKADRT